MKKYIVPLAIAAAFAIPTTAHADGPVVNASIDCDTFTVHVEGLQPGDRVVLEQGSNPPAQPIISAAGTVDTVLASSKNPWFDADVVLIVGGQLTTAFHQYVDCTTPADEPAPAVDPVAVVAAAAAPAPVVAPVERPRRVEVLALRRLNGAW